MDFQDILYDVRDGAAWITINRPERLNAFRGRTCDELIEAVNRAGYEREIGVIVLAGAGERALCTGDLSAHSRCPQAAPRCRRERAPLLALPGLPPNALSGR